MQLIDIEWDEANDRFVFMFEYNSLQTSTYITRKVIKEDPEWVANRLLDIYDTVV